MPAADRFPIIGMDAVVFAVGKRKSQIDESWSSTAAQACSTSR